MAEQAPEVTGNVFVCADVQIEHPADFTIPTEGWRPKFVEGEFVVLEDEREVLSESYEDGPMKIFYVLVKLCTAKQVNEYRPYKRLAGLIAIGASAERAGIDAVKKVGAELVGIANERYPQDAVLAFRMTDHLKRYTG